MQIGILGMGRLGRTLAALLPAAGHTPLPWRRSEPFPGCEVALLTVSDGAIAEVAAALPPGPVVLHTSGATDWRVLRPHSPAGSLHPLQSFPGPEVGIPPVRGVPAAVAGDPEAVAIARALAEDLGFAPFEVPGDRRLYHAAAVVAGNFATVLMGEACRLMAAAGVAPDQAAAARAPLARASIDQCVARGPEAALTGPFARGDHAVVAAHLAAIEASCPGLAAIYRAIGARAAEMAGAAGHISPEESEALIRSLK